MNSTGGAYTEIHILSYTHTHTHTHTHTRFYVVQWKKVEEAWRSRSHGIQVYLAHPSMSINCRRSASLSLERLSVCYWRRFCSCPDRRLLTNDTTTRFVNASAR